MFRALNDEEIAEVRPWRAPGLMVSGPNSGVADGALAGTRIYHADQLVEQVMPAAVQRLAELATGVSPDARVSNLQPHTGAPAVASAEAVQAAYDEGFVAGQQAGQSAGQAQEQAAFQQSGQALQSALSQLSRSAELQESQIEGEVYELARRMASRLLQREIEAEPAAMLGVVRRALDLLPSASDPVVWMNPQDAEAVSPLLPAQQAGLVRPDAQLARGGCRVEAGAAHLEAGIDALLDSLVLHEAPDAGVVGDHAAASVPANAVASQSAGLNRAGGPPEDLFDDE